MVVEASDELLDKCAALSRWLRVVALCEASEDQLDGLDCREADFRMGVCELGLGTVNDFGWPRRSSGGRIGQPFLDQKWLAHARPLRFSGDTRASTSSPQCGQVHVSYDSSFVLCFPFLLTTPAWAKSCQTDFGDMATRFPQCPVAIWVTA